MPESEQGAPLPWLPAREAVAGTLSNGAGVAGSGAGVGLLWAQFLEVEPYEVEIYPLSGRRTRSTLFKSYKLLSVGEEGKFGMRRECLPGIRTDVYICN